MGERETGTRGACILNVAGIVGKLDDRALADLWRGLAGPTGADDLSELIRLAYALPDALRGELIARLRRKVLEVRGVLVRAEC